MALGSQVEAPGQDETGSGGGGGGGGGGVKPAPPLVNGGTTSPPAADDNGRSPPFCCDKLKSVFRNAIWPRFVSPPERPSPGARETDGRTEEERLRVSKSLPLRNTRAFEQTSIKHAGSSGSSPEAACGHSHQGLVAAAVGTHRGMLLPGLCFYGVNPVGSGAGAPVM